MNVISSLNSMYPVINDIINHEIHKNIEIVVKGVQIVDTTYKNKFTMLC